MFSGYNDSQLAVIFFGVFMVRTEIGECSMIYNDVEYVFRPSFKNIRKICDPSELAGFYASLAGVLEQKITVAKACGLFDAAISFQNEIRAKAAKVLSSCCDTDCLDLVENEEVAPTFALKNVALSLLTHGVIGVVKDEKPSQSNKKKTSDIDIYEYADIAEAHLGIPYPLSENLTKTELDRKLRIKFPATDKTNNAPSDDDYYAAMAELDRLDEARSRAQ